MFLNCFFLSSNLTFLPTGHNLPALPAAPPECWVSFREPGLQLSCVQMVPGGLSSPFPCLPWLQNCWHGRI